MPQQTLRIKKNTSNVEYMKNKLYKARLTSDTIVNESDVGG